MTGREAGKRSHPPTLTSLALRAARDEALVRPGDVVLCACSGGPDSTALLHVLAALREKLRIQLHAHGVDHGLRPEAPAELEGVRALAERLQVPFGTTRVAVAAGGNLQGRARAARLEALREAAAAARAAVIATGHTADDRAETVLLRLLRGAGTRGLAVLPPRGPLPGGPGLSLIRPLVRARRSDVLAHLGRHAIPWSEDPSNRDPRFARVRVRLEVIPLLEELSPGIVLHLCSLADMLAALPAAEGPEAGLGRAQRQSLQRARRLGRRSVRLRLKGGRELDVPTKP